MLKRYDSPKKGQYSKYSIFSGRRDVISYAYYCTLEWSQKLINKYRVHQTRSVIHVWKEMTEWCSVLEAEVKSWVFCESLI